MRVPLLPKGLCPAVLAVIALIGALAAGHAVAVPPTEIYKRAQQGKPALIDTMKTLVLIESGSKDIEGLDKIAGVITERLRGMNDDVKLADPSDHAHRMADTPKEIGKMVLARFKGEGKCNIMLIAHMDTVYLKGMLAQQPFRVDGDRAYDLGIADDKNDVAVILHTVSVLQAINFRQYSTLTVLINGDEEISSPDARVVQTKLGAEQGAVFSYEDTRVMSNKLSLATSGIGAILLDVKGKASHAGGASEQGRNALYELSHQVFQMRDLSEPETGLKVNWAVAQAGTNRNIIPAVTTAQADVRLLRVADADRLEETVNERIKNKSVSDTQVTAKFKRRRPPLEATPASHTLVEHAQKIYGELGKTLEVDDKAEGGGTDAAFAASKTKAPVIECFGSANFGAHSNDAEYVGLNSIVPCLYLLTRMVMDVSCDRVGLTK